MSVCAARDADDSRGRLTLSLPSSTRVLSQPFKKKCITDIMSICSIIIFPPSKLCKAKFFILCDVIFLVRLQGKNLNLITLGKGRFNWVQLAHLVRQVITSRDECLSQFAFVFVWRDLGCRGFTKQKDTHFWKANAKKEPRLGVIFQRQPPSEDITSTGYRYGLDTACYQENSTGQVPARVCCV